MELLFYSKLISKKVIIFYKFSFYIIFIILKNRERINPEKIRRLLLFFSFLLFFFLPALIFSDFRFWVKDDFWQRLLFLPFSSFFFIIWEIVLLRYILKWTTINPFFIVLEESTSNDGLSLREKEIVNLIVLGLSNKEIAQRLYISELTVKTHLQRIYKKLNVSNKIQLINFIKQNRIK